MKIYKIILPILFLTFISIYWFLESLPLEFNVSKNTIVNSNPEEVYLYLKNLNNWEKFNPVSSKDKETKYIYSFTNDTIGSSVVWNSESEGKGKVTFISITKNKIIYSFNMVELNQNTTGTFLIESQKNKTKLTWNLFGKLEKNPISKLIGFFSENIFGYDMNISIIKIKSNMENKKFN